MVAAIERLLAVASQPRNRVNYRRRHHALIRNPEAWNTTCSAMDVVGDTCQALRSYSTRVPLPDHDKGAAYLLAYGVLHTLYLQQDAVYWWCKCLGVKPVADFGDPGAWSFVSNARVGASVGVSRSRLADWARRSKAPDRGSCKIRNATYDC